MRFTNSDNLFKEIPKKKPLIKYNSSWIKIIFNKKVPSGKYLISYQGFDFNINSISQEQHLVKYISNTKQVFSFEYNDMRDSKEYYFKLINVEHYVPIKIHIQLFNEYYKNNLIKPDSREFFLLFGCVVGFMLMIGIMNMVIFNFSRKYSFIYYAMMQLFMIAIMTYQFGIVSLDTFLYNSATLFSSIFATLFMRSFLSTSKFTPILDKVLVFYFFLLGFDFIHLSIQNYSLVSFFGLYGIFGLIYFLIGFLRIRQGFMPAKFFLVGWSFLVIGILLTEHYGTIYGFSPFLFGSPLEAIFLAIGLAYKLKLELDEKKEQQELLIHQSKLASMGEMIGNIAHQWKQPLNKIFLAILFHNL